MGWIENTKIDFDALVFDGDDQDDSFLYVFLKSIQKEEWFATLRAAINTLKMEPFFWSEKMINKKRIVNYLKEQKKQTFSFLAKCHSNEIKNGFGTMLNDETFEKYYHIIS